MSTVGCAAVRWATPSGAETTDSEGDLLGARLQKGRAGGRRRGAGGEHRVEQQDERDRRGVGTFE